MRHHTRAGNDACLLAWLAGHGSHDDTAKEADEAHDDNEHHDEPEDDVEAHPRRPAQQQYQSTAHAQTQARVSDCSGDAVATNNTICNQNGGVRFDRPLGNCTVLQPAVVRATRYNVIKHRRCERRATGKAQQGAPAGGGDEEGCWDNR